MILQPVMELELKLFFENLICALHIKGDYVQDFRYSVTWFD